MTEGREPTPDRGQIVGFARLNWKARRPITGLDIPPGVPTQERDLGRVQPMADHIVRKEIVERVGANLVLRALQGAAGVGRHQFGRYFLAKYCCQDAVRLRIKLIAFDAPTDQEL